jgi:hypothetical protein
MDGSDTDRVMSAFVPIRHDAHFEAHVQCTVKGLMSVHGHKYVFYSCMFTHIIMNIICTTASMYLPYIGWLFAICKLTLREAYVHIHTHCYSS